MLRGGLRSIGAHQHDAVRRALAAGSGALHLALGDQRIELGVPLALRCAGCLLKFCTGQLGVSECSEDRLPVCYRAGIGAFALCDGCPRAGSWRRVR